ncbi:MAG TPA: hypothetical protein VLH08_13880 [Acidobacteriota bacterium]|nr:hypothetical protein [Acidobacteriota bacterium]
MKRHAWFTIFLIIFAARNGICIDSASNTIDLKDCKMMVQFYELWKDSLFGREPDRIERAAWIQYDSQAGFEFVNWALTTEKQSITWDNTIPENVIAAVHTHPPTVDPKPSKGDALVAARLKIPIYTISRKGIWKVLPDGQVIQEAKRHWQKEAHDGTCKTIQKAESKDIQLNRDSQ